MINIVPFERIQEEHNQATKSSWKNELKMMSAHANIYMY